MTSQKIRSGHNHGRDYYRDMAAYFEAISAPRLVVSGPEARTTKSIHTRLSAELLALVEKHQDDKHTQLLFMNRHERRAAPKEARKEARTQARLAAEARRAARRQARLEYKRGHRRSTDSD